jgi:hypothetical protein
MTIVPYFPFTQRVSTGGWEALTMVLSSAKTKGFLTTFKTPGLRVRKSGMELLVPLMYSISKKKKHLKLLAIEQIFVLKQYFQHLFSKHILQICNQFSIKFFDLIN